MILGFLYNFFCYLLASTFLLSPTPEVIVENYHLHVPIIAQLLLFRYQITVTIPHPSYH